ncbi:MAG TPA: ABC transporter permease, partial [Thermoanaerobaculia bacterium]|nr:ABC transporter permease [Thermoanaerobaculia bacterium]
MRPSAKVAAAVLGLAILAALLAPLLPSAPATRIDLTRRLVPPASAPPLGTDELGRDLFSRLLRGATVSLGVAGAAVLASAAMGSTLGLVAGE